MGLVQPCFWIDPVSEKSEIPDQYRWDKPFENGETLRKLIVTSRFALMKSYDKLYESQKQRLHILLHLFPDIRKRYCFVQQLRNIYNKHYQPAVTRLKLRKWYDKLVQAKFGAFKTVAETMEKHNILTILKTGLQIQRLSHLILKLKHSGYNSGR